ncbi:MAG: adenylate/guanylate cyclase domain-containing protein [Treponema sp.]|jgi:class 3 adenylate cyclase/HAMP domain-containing protein|nr:adenylate/guanylate cyclase domain-containing protein [Treponema sp.]
MKIRAKIFLVVLPLIILPLCISQAASYSAAVRGIDRAAREFLDFKIAELQTYAENQWSLLVENGYAGRSDMVEAARIAVETYARGIILNDTEIIFAVDGAGDLVMKTRDLEILPEETGDLLAILENEDTGLLQARIGGKERIFRAFWFTPFGWNIILSEERDSFYRDADVITFLTIITAACASAAAVLLLAFFSRFLTSPLARIVKVMNRMISSGDLSERVEVEYRDETGELAHTFNRMTRELERAWAEIKRYAFQAVLAGKKEQRIRGIFQKYVPRNVIEEFFSSPDPNMLRGKNATLAILFSDIRGFTSISEDYANSPEHLVESLNRYFSGQVDIIMNRNGIVDKYIGDAIMAFWGAPVQQSDDAQQAVCAALEMIDALDGFNETQRRFGLKEFHIGVGINYGLATVGNIGSERKMDYTVIGDNVNLASRMEGLTKTYHAELLITQSLYEKLRELLSANGDDGNLKALNFRLLDTVAVKGKTQGVRIYAVKRNLAPNEKQAWDIHNQAMDYYYRRQFREAAEQFRDAAALLPGDFNARGLFNRCKTYLTSPPPVEWNGVEVMQSK